MRFLVYRVVASGAGRVPTVPGVYGYVNRSPELPDKREPLSLPLLASCRKRGIVGSSAGLASRHAKLVDVCYDPTVGHWPRLVAIDEALMLPSETAIFGMDTHVIPPQWIRGRPRREIGEPWFRSGADGACEGAVAPPRSTNRRTSSERKRILLPMATRGRTPARASASTCCGEVPSSIATSAARNSGVRLLVSTTPAELISRHRWPTGPKTRSVALVNKGVPHER
jgi:hypothetical protein